MARYYRRRYTRVVKPKVKWASNISQIALPPPTTGASDTRYGYVTPICANAGQVAVPIPTIVKCGNFKVQMDSVFESNDVGTMINATAYIIYVPEGAGPVAAANPPNPTTLEYFNWIEGIVTKHPEWLLGCKMMGSDWVAQSRANYDRVQFSTRLKRNLNSGDAVCLAVTAQSTRQGVEAGKVVGVQGHAMVQFWTRAN